jgi:PiT family inorganic phosphate transporter
MDISIIIFLLGGLFLGWSLGANDAANVFGTAVGTRMVRFKTAAVVCSIFVILAETAPRSGRARNYCEQREAYASGGRRRAIRQWSPRSARNWTR